MCVFATQIKDQGIGTLEKKRWCRWREPILNDMSMMKFQIPHYLSFLLIFTQLLSFIEFLLKKLFEF